MEPSFTVLLNVSNNLHPTVVLIYLDIIMYNHHRNSDTWNTIYNLQLWTTAKSSAETISNNDSFTSMQSKPLLDDNRLARNYAMCRLR